MSKKSVEMKIRKMFKRTVQKDVNIQKAYFLIHSDKQNFHLNLAEGSTGELPANVQQPYFIASISKLITYSTLNYIGYGRKGIQVMFKALNKIL